MQTHFFSASDPETQQQQQQQQQQLYCALGTKSLKTLKGNNCEKKEHSHSEIAKIDGNVKE